MVTADGRCLAFMDLFPAVPGHVLVVPRAHAASLAALSSDDSAAMIRFRDRNRCFCGDDADGAAGRRGAASFGAAQLVAAL